MSGYVFQERAPHGLVRDAAGTVLQQPVARAQMIKLLTSGRTDLLDKFISKHGRPFPACLVVDADGKVGFEFPAREVSDGVTPAVKKDRAAGGA